MAKGKKTTGKKAFRSYAPGAASGKITGSGRFYGFSVPPRQTPSSEQGYRVVHVPTPVESRWNPAATEPAAVSEVKALLDRWYHEGKVSEVESVHLGLLDGQPHLEVVYWVPESLWVEGGHYELYRALRRMQRGGLVITPTAFPKQVERAG